MFQEQQETQKTEIKLIRALFLHHSESSIEKAVTFNLIKGCNPEIDTFCYEKETSKDFWNLVNKDFKFKGLENYNLLIIEGNLGEKGSPNPSNLCTSIIKQAIATNKQIIILIITATIECAVKILMQHEEHAKIYYIMQKNQGEFNTSNQLLLPFINKGQVFRSFQHKDLSSIYSLLTLPLARSDYSLTPSSSTDLISYSPLSSKTTESYKSTEQTPSPHLNQFKCSSSFHNIKDELLNLENKTKEKWNKVKRNLFTHIKRFD